MLPSIRYTDSTPAIFADQLIHPAAYGVPGYESELRHVMRQHHASVDHALTYLEGQKAKRELWWLDSAYTDHADAHQRAFDKARELIREGWPEGSQQVSEIAAQVSAAMPEGRRVFRRFHREAGAYPAIPRFLAGDPRCMVDAERARGGSKIITLLVDCNAGASTNGNTMKGRAAACLAVADTLERAGWQLEIIAFEMSPGGTSATGKREGVEVAVSAKRAGDAVDPLRLAFCLGHELMLRGLLLCLDGATLAQRDLWKRGGTDVGVVGGLPASLPPEMVPAGTYYVRNATQYSYDPSLMTPEEAAHPHSGAIAMARAIIADLKAQGCPAIQ
jgi:hypothetical protein